MRNEIKKLESNNLQAVMLLIVPFIFASVGMYLSFYAQNIFTWASGQILLGIFFFQCFIMLHETGHFSYFTHRKVNKVFGHFFGFLSFLPFTSWVEIHNLHHRWTGWRDKDPTTSGTVSPNFNAFTRFIVNICWALFLPLFTIAYRIGNYWNFNKLKKYIQPKKLLNIYINQFVLILLYLIVLLFFGEFIIKYILAAYIFSLIISDIFILSQHSHIEIPISNGNNIKPLKYVEQLPYSRSIGLHFLIAKYIFLNFNLHELHHAYPGIPAYHLQNIKISTPNLIPFITYFQKSKKMSGMKFVFSTSKNPLK